VSRSTYDGRRSPQRVDILPTVIYVGYGDYDRTGTPPASSAAAWTIKKVTLTNGSPTNIQWTNEGSGVWDNRATETYY